MVARDPDHGGCPGPCWCWQACTWRGRWPLSCLVWGNQPHPRATRRFRADKVVSPPLVEGPQTRTGPGGMMGTSPGGGMMGGRVWLAADGTPVTTVAATRAGSAPKAPSRTGNGCACRRPCPPSTYRRDPAVAHHVLRRPARHLMALVHLVPDSGGRGRFGHRVAHVLRHRLPGTVVSAVADPARRLCDVGLVRVVGDVRGL